MKVADGELVQDAGIAVQGAADGEEVRTPALVVVNAGSNQVPDAVVAAAHAPERPLRLEHGANFVRRIDAEVAVDRGNFEHASVLIGQQEDAAESADDKGFLGVGGIEVPDRAAILQAQVTSDGAPFLVDHLFGIAEQSVVESSMKNESDANQNDGEEKGVAEGEPDAESGPSLPAKRLGVQTFS